MKTNQHNKTNNIYSNNFTGDSDNNIAQEDDKTDI